jgi:hypothetical protein
MNQSTVFSRWITARPTINKNGSPISLSTIIDSATNEYIDMRLLELSSSPFFAECSIEFL